VAPFDGAPDGSASLPDEKRQRCSTMIVLLFQGSIVIVTLENARLATKDIGRSVAERRNTL
jgi:hypothetical protein